MGINGDNIFIDGMERGGRYLSTQVNTPVQSSLRNRKPAIIPPFSFVGLLEAGVSGIWYPTSTTILTNISAVAIGAGITPASFTVYKKEPTLFPESVDPTVVAEIILGANGRKVIAEIPHVVVSPHDKVFVSSWNNSEHLNVVIQMVGVIMI